MNSKNRAYNTLDLIGRLYDNTKDNGFDKNIFETHKSELKKLQVYFHTTREQTLFLSIIFALNINDSTVNLQELINHFSCNPIDILKYHSAIDELCKRGIIKKKKSLYGGNLVFANDSFIVQEKVVKSIIASNPIPNKAFNLFETELELLSKIYELAKERDYDDISTDQMLAEMDLILSQNTKFPLFKYINNLDLNKINKFIFLFAIFNTLYNSEKLILYVIIEKLIDKSSLRITIFQLIMTKRSPLIQNKYIDLIESSFIDDTEIRLSKLSLNKLKHFGFKPLMAIQENENIIIPSNILKKNLYYNEGDRHQLDLLLASLHEDKLKDIQFRLAKKKTRIGITCLLSGPPGVGKTEFVLQLARKTGRKILKIDISQSKSMYFGESSKIIKQLFTVYKELCETNEKEPIFFLNEADGLISKRKDVALSNTAQTENTIQNIILEELEKFEGIFIATTNLIENFDKAFESRFLIKAEISQPNSSTQQKIWKYKLPILNNSDCEILAGKYNLSGREIDNVVSKCVIEEILYGNKTNLFTVSKYCELEHISNKKNRIVGFNLIQ